MLVHSQCFKWPREKYETVRRILKSEIEKKTNQSGRRRQAKGDCSYGILFGGQAASSSTMSFNYHYGFLCHFTMMANIRGGCGGSGPPQGTK